MIVDSLVNFWNKARNTDPASFLPADLRGDLIENDITGIIVTSPVATEEANDLLSVLAKDHKYIIGSTAYIDLDNTDADALRGLVSGNPKCKAIKIKIDDKEAVARLSSDAVKSKWQVLSELNLAIDIISPVQYFESLADFIAANPGNRFCIENPFGATNLFDIDLPSWKKGLERLAASDHAYSKTGGLLSRMEDEEWEYDQMLPYLNILFGCFGSDRIMYASNAPFIRHAGYEDVLSLVEEFMYSFHKTEKSQVMALNALTYYKII